MRLAVFMLLSVLLMTLDRLHQLEFLRAGLGVALYPVQMAVHVPLSMGNWVYDTFSLRRTLVEENQRLRQERMVIEARLGRFEELEAENRRLRNLLDSSVKVGEQVLIAEVVAVEMDPFSRQILLSKGSRSRVYSGQPIIDADGVMGQVVHVNPLTSAALLITDPGHALPVQLNRNGLRSVAVGTGAASTLALQYLPNNADVQVGDLVVTSGLGGRFPSGYPVGTVTAVETDAGRPFADVVVEPAVKLERNREVLLVWPASVPINPPRTDEAPG